MITFGSVVPTGLNCAIRYTSHWQCSSSPFWAVSLPYIVRRADNLFPMAHRTELSLRSDLDIKECFRRLREVTDPAQLTFFGDYKGSNAVLAKFGGNRFRIFRRRYGGKDRNSFAPVFYGKIYSEGRSSQIRGYFGLDRRVALFLGFWLCFAAGINVLLTWEYVSNSSQSIRGDDWFAFLGPPALLLFGIILPKYGRWAAKSDEGFLKEFLETTLAAKSGASQQPPKSQTVA